MNVRNDRRVNGILKASLTPFLKSLGFHKTAMVYRAQQADLTWIINVQLSQWNDDEHVSFTLNGGIYVPGVVSRYSPRPEPIRPSLLDCCVSVRIGMLDESKLDVWWSFRGTQWSEKKVRQVGSSIREHVQRLLLPFLSPLDSQDAVAEFLSDPVTSETDKVCPQSDAIRRSYAAIIKMNLGKTVEALRDIETARSLAVGTPVQGHIEDLAHSLSRQAGEERGGPE